MNVPAPFLAAVPAASLKALAIVVGGSALIWLMNRLFVARARQWAAKTSSPVDDALVDLLSTVGVPLLYFSAVTLGLRELTLYAEVQYFVDRAGTLLLTFLGVRFAVRTVRFFLTHPASGPLADDVAQRRTTALMPIVTVSFWIGGALFLLENWGFRLSTLVTGLGIGGVAVALASQAVLGDLFSYFCIMFDRPFEIGDFIILGEFMGTVERIGLKTTRLRSLGGEELIFSNTDLTGSRVSNYKRMNLRRVLFRLGVTYDTPPEMMEALPAAIRRIIDVIPQTRFDRAHFSAFADSSLTIEVVYFVLTNDYNAYMDIQQTINLALQREFRARGVEFAFPTYTVHLATPGEWISGRRGPG